jgi:hypothetical protein
MKNSTEFDKMDYKLNDFVLKNKDKELKYYVLNNDCIILGKLFNNEPLKIETDKDIELEKYILKINEYIYNG